MGQWRQGGQMPPLKKLRGQCPFETGLLPPDKIQSSMPKLPQNTRSRFRVFFAFFSFFRVFCKIAFFCKNRVFLHNLAIFQHFYLFMHKIIAFLQKFFEKFCRKHKVFRKKMFNFQNVQKCSKNVQKMSGRTFRALNRIFSKCGRTFF